MSQIVSPSVPYQGFIPNGLHDGKLIEIRGSVPYGASRFEINFMTGLDPSSDRPFHMSVRFTERQVVRNAFENNVWGVEERHGTFHFNSGRDFYITILVEPTVYRVAVDHQHLFEFPHRIHFSRVTSILIDGSVKIDRIEFIDKQISGFPSTTYQPIPSVCPIPNSVTGFPSTTCQPNPNVGLFPNPVSGHFQPNPSVDPFSNRVTVSDFIFTQKPVVCPQPANISQPAVCPRPANISQPAVCPRPANISQPASTISSYLAPVYNPSIPYAYPIYGGIKPGMMIYISGRPSASANKFTLNFQAGAAPYPPPDIAFHFDVRFYNHSVVRNSRLNNTWQQEETPASRFPFQPAVNFDMVIRVESDRFTVTLNGQHFVDFRHRMQPLSQFDTLSIENDIVVSSIRFA